MDINYKDIGKRIQERRNKLGISQEKLAEMIDLTVGHLSGIENGKTKFSFPAIMHIANGLDTTTDPLVCGSLIKGVAIMQSEASELLADCTPDEAVIMIDTLKCLKKSLRQNKSSGEG